MCKLYAKSLSGGGVILIKPCGPSRRVGPRLRPARIGSMRGRVESRLSYRISAFLLVAFLRLQPYGFTEYRMRGMAYLAYTVCDVRAACVVTVLYRCPVRARVLYFLPSCLRFQIRT